MVIGTRILYLPDWLSGDDRAALASQFDAEVVVSGELQYGGWLRTWEGSGSAWSARALRRTISGVDLTILELVVPSEIEHSTAHAWPDPDVTAEYVATCERGHTALCDRAIWLIETSTLFAKNVDDIVNLPETRRLQDFVRCLHLRCAESRGKVAVLQGEIAMSLDNAYSAGLPLEEAASESAPFVTAVASTPLVQHTIERLQRASRLLQTAASTLSVSNDLLKAMLEQYRDRDAKDLNLTMKIVGPALVAVVGAGGVANAISRPLASASSMLGPSTNVWVWGVVAVVTAVVLGSTALLGFSRLRDFVSPSRWLDRIGSRFTGSDRSEIEERINALVAGYSYPLRTWLDSEALLESLRDSKKRGEALRTIKTAEAQAAGLLERILDDIKGCCDMWQQRSKGGPRLGLDVAGVRRGAVETLMRSSSADGLITLLCLDIEPWSLAMPDLAATLWLKGCLFPWGSPISWSMVTSCLANVIVVGLEGSPRTAAVCMEGLKQAARELAGLDGDRDIVTALDEPDESVKCALRDRSVGEILARLSFLRLSALCEAVEGRDTDPSS